MNINSEENNIINYDIISASLNIAHSAHSGQVDKQGNDYINHPLEVAKMLEVFGDRAYMAGLLHDVIEDSDYTAQDLLDSNIPPSVVSAVNIVSRPDNRSLSYIKWIKSIKEISWVEDDLLSHQELQYSNVSVNSRVPLAVIVKLADNYHNSLGPRAEYLSDGLRKRYSRARELLEKDIPDNVIKILRDRIPA